MREMKLSQLIARARGVKEAEKYASFVLSDTECLASTANELLESVQPSVGACASMSAAWVGMLKDHHNIPAVVVTGDLKIGNTRIFKCKKNIPEPKKIQEVYTGTWDGHCWMELNGLIGDISIFRTAYALGDESKLKKFVTSTFGQGRGAFVCHRSELPEQMRYIPKYVLTDRQIDSLIVGMGVFK